MATNEPLQLNLGSLRSAMSLTLHTHHASRIWHGRAAADGRPGIVGLNGYIAVMNKMKRGSEQDDPYSDWWMLRIEDKFDQTKTTLQSLREQVDQAWPALPPALSLGENLNVQPVNLPLFVNAQLGFAAVYLLADYDDIARKLILAHHTALIDRSTLERWLNEGAHALRSLFSLAQQYRYSGDARRLRREERRSAGRAGEIRRTAAGRAGRHAPLPFAPPIVRRGLQQTVPDDVLPQPLPPTTKAAPPPAANTPKASEVIGRQSDPNRQGAYFQACNRLPSWLEHAAYLKGLLKPFKGKGILRPGPASASPCATS
jgi:integrating conjugative element protein (TIGR03761 family)